MPLQSLPEVRQFASSVQAARYIRGVLLVLIVSMLASCSIHRPSPKHELPDSRSLHSAILDVHSHSLSPLLDEAIARLKLPGQLSTFWGGTWEPVHAYEAGVVLSTSAHWMMTVTREELQHLSPDDQLQAGTYDLTLDLSILIDVVIVDGRGGPVLSVRCMRITAATLRNAEFSSESEEWWPESLYQQDDTRVDEDETPEERAHRTERISQKRAWERDSAIMPHVLGPSIELANRVFADDESMIQRTPQVEVVLPTSNDEWVDGEGLPGWRLLGVNRDGSGATYLNRSNGEMLYQPVDGPAWHLGEPHQRVGILLRQEYGELFDETMGQRPIKSCDDDDSGDFDREEAVTTRDQLLERQRHYSRLFLAPEGGASKLGDDGLLVTVMLHPEMIHPRMRRMLIQRHVSRGWEQVYFGHSLSKEYDRDLWESLPVSEYTLANAPVPVVLLFVARDGVAGATPEISRDAHLSDAKCLFRPCIDLRSQEEWLHEPFRFILPVGSGRAFMIDWNVSGGRLVARQANRLEIGDWINASQASPYQVRGADRRARDSMSWLGSGMHYDQPVELSVLSMDGTVFLMDSVLSGEFEESLLLVISPVSRVSTASNSSKDGEEAPDWFLTEVVELPTNEFATQFVLPVRSSNGIGLVVVGEAWRGAPDGECKAMLLDQKSRCWSEVSMSESAKEWLRDKRDGHRFTFSAARRTNAIVPFTGSDGVGYGVFFELNTAWDEEVGARYHVISLRPAKK